MCLLTYLSDIIIIVNVTLNVCITWLIIEKYTLAMVHKGTVCNMNVT